MNKITNVKLVINHAKNVKENQQINVLVVQQEASLKLTPVLKNALMVNSEMLKITLVMPVIHHAQLVVELKPITVYLVTQAHS